MRRIVYKDNYDYWIRKYRTLQQNICFRRMFLKLAFGRNEEGKIILSQGTVAEIEGAEITKDYAAYKFLDAYQAAFPGFRYSGWSHTDRRCRIALGDGFDDDDRVRIEQERARAENAPMVNFFTGKLLDAHTRMELRDEAKRDIPRAQCDDAIFIQEYINNLSPRGFANLLPNLGVARMAVSRLSAANPKYTKILRDYQFELLNEIEEQPQPYLQPSRAGRTIRLMPSNRGICLLEKSVRRALAPDWTELDLRVAQCAICAKLWDVTSVQAFLRDRTNNIWFDIADYLRVVPIRTKKALKNAGMYPLLFGMPEPNVAAGVTKELAKLGYVLQGQPGMSYGKRFLTHPLIHDMLIAREHALATIIADGGAMNCYGEWIAYQPELENENSVLAQLAQALEMRCIVPVFRKAQESNGELTVMLYQFDGVSITTQRRVQRDYWINQAIASVDEQVQILGIETQLAVTW